MKKLILTVQLICILAGTLNLSFGQSTSELDRKYTGFYSHQSPRWKTGIVKIFLKNQCNEKGKKEFWKNIKAQRDKGLYSHYIYEIIFERDKYKIPAWKKTQKMLDDFFKNTPESPTYPELLYAVCPAEENITWGGQIELQNKVYDHLKKKYKMRVFQWLSEPLAPRLDIKADGWIFDAYSIKGEEFYRHTQKFILYGKTVVPILWAAEPGLDGYFKNSGCKGIYELVSPKFQYCRELNLPVILFACSKKLGSVNIWMHSKKAPFPELRDFFFKELAKLSSDEDFETTKHPTPVFQCSGNKFYNFNYVADFSNFSFVDHCKITGVHNIKVSKQGMTFVSKSKGQSIIQWHFQGKTKFKQVSISLKLKPLVKNSQYKLEYSVDAKKWHKCKGFTNQYKINTLKNKNLFLRLSLIKGKFLINRMSLKAKLTPLKNKAIKLTANGNFWEYIEDFKTMEFSQRMQNKAVKELQFQKGRIGVTGKKGHKINWKGKQKFICPKAIKSLEITINCNADLNNWGGKVKAFISQDGYSPLKQVETDGTKRSFCLKLKHDFKQKTKVFFLHLQLINGSGVYRKNHFAASISEYKIKAN